jgi:hypothetical protein
MDVDLPINDRSPEHGYTQDKIPDSSFSMHPPTVDGLTNGPTNEIAASFPMYAPEQEEYILSIAQEAAELFPTGKVYKSIKELRKELGGFGQKKGFAVTTVGSRLLYTRSYEPTAQINQREKMNSFSLISMGKTKDIPVFHTMWVSFQNILFADAEPK